MGSEWKTVRLGNHVDACLGKMLDKNKNQGTMHPYLGNKEVRWGSFDLSNLSKMKFLDHEHERYGLRSGDLIVCEGGEPGRCAIWKDEVPGMKIQKALHRIRPHRGLDSIFLYYWFCYAGRFGLLDPFFTGTTIQHLTGKALAELQIPLPPLPEQKSIAHILGSLDDKIELNRRMNETLEGLAQALFKSWFVDFDPVIDNALAAGNPIPEELEERAEVRRQALADGSANREVARAFPDAFQFTEEMGWIPAGWEAVPFKNFTTVKTARVGDQDVPEYSSTNEGLIPREDRFKKQLSKSKSNNKLIRYGYLVFGMSRKVLNFGLMHQEVGSVSSAYNVFKINQSKIFPEFVESYIRARPNYYYGILGSSSREGQSLSKSNFNLTLMLIPPSEIQKKFQRLRMDLASKQMFNTSQSECLTNLRDTLLPKLISGELRVPDAAKLAEEALT